MKSRQLLRPDVVAIECTKEGVKFACNGDIGSGAVTLRSHTDVEKPERNIDINLSEPVALTFSLKYLVNFCKASGLSDSVRLCLSNEVPLLVEYSLSNNSYLRFYLAPKVHLVHRRGFRLLASTDTHHRLVTKSRISKGWIDLIRRSAFDHGVVRRFCTASHEARSCGGCDFFMLLKTAACS